MNVDKVMETLEAGQTVPGTTITRVIIGAKDINNYGLRRKSVKGAPEGAPAPESYLVWCIGIGQMEQPKNFFYGHKLRDAFVKALEWKCPPVAPPAQPTG
jgi:hypothetical protein